MAQISLQTLTDYWKKMANAVDAQDNMFMMKSMQQKWRDSFGGAALDATKWDSVVGSGGSLTVSGGQLTMASGATINADTYILSKTMFTVPFKFSIGFTLSQRIANQTFYVEMVSVDPTTGVPDGKHCCGLIFDGTTATQAKYRVQNSSVTPLDSALSTFPTTASGSFYEIEPFSDEVWFHGGTLDSTNGRANSYRRHQQIPDPNAVYKVRLRWLNGGTAPASSTSAVIQYVACQDYAELTAEITSGRGNAAVGQALAVQVLNTAAVSGTVTANLSSNALLGAESTTNLGVGATFTGTAKDGGTTLAYTRLRVLAGHTAGLVPGHLVIQQSTDNATWKETHRVPVPSDANHRCFEFPWLLRYVRVLFINGSVAQTYMFLQSTGVRTDGSFDFDKTLAFIGTNTVLAGAATWTGDTLNLGANHSYNKVRAIVFTDQAGTLYIDNSRDGSTWRTALTQAVSANTAIIAEEEIVGQYVRVRYTNGATLQTVMDLNYSLIKS